MERLLRHHYEKILVGCAFFFLLTLGLLVVWNMLVLIQYVNKAVELPASGAAYAGFHLKEAEELNLQLMP